LDQSVPAMFNDSPSDGHKRKNSTSIAVIEGKPSPAPCRKIPLLTYLHQIYQVDIRILMKQAQLALQVAH
jgi:hypothetical protein